MKHESKIKGFTGHIVTPDFMTLPQVRTFETGFFGDEPPTGDDEGRVYISQSREKLLPFVLEFVKEWHLEGVPEKPEEKDIPYRVLNWIVQKLFELWQAEQVPNE